ncbi:MAG TPA: twin-arginine translocation signal domain-containing protein, partial [Verrucomicrobiae bacterium]|nr:twin-arginine translocation signal domain-containing protein [Verrucomicrobiae bacterium]
MKGKTRKEFEVSRRSFLKIGMASSAATVVGANALRADKVLAALPPDNPKAKILENFPTSPFIVNPFIDPMPQPKAMRTGWRPDPTVTGLQTPWTVRRSAFLAGTGNPTGAGVVLPGPGLNQQDVYGKIPTGGVATNGQGETTTLPVDHEGTHQIWPQPGVGPNAANFNRLLNWPAAGIAPDLYHIRMQPGP